MIVQLRGGSGSGKSTLVRHWVDDHGPHNRMMMDMHAAQYGLDHIDCAKSRPFALAFPQHKVAVVGHYDAPGGGADMIKSVYHIYEVVKVACETGYHVLVESLFMSKDAKATTDLLSWAKDQGIPVHIILMDVPEDECYESVMARRRALGKEERHLRAHAKDYHAAHHAMIPCYEEWQKAGLINYYHLNRADAASKVRELLG